MSKLTRSGAQCIERIRKILAGARASAMQSVNSAMVAAYWEVGREIVQEEQRGQQRAKYGKHLLKELSARLTREFGKGFGERNLRNIRRFYLTFADREPPIWQSAIAKFARDEKATDNQAVTQSPERTPLDQIQYTPCTEFPATSTDEQISHPPGAKFAQREKTTDKQLVTPPAEATLPSRIRHTPCAKSAAEHQAQIHHPPGDKSPSAEIDEQISQPLAAKFASKAHNEISSPPGTKSVQNEKPTDKQLVTRSSKTTPPDSIQCPPGTEFAAGSQEQISHTPCAKSPEERRSLSAHLSWTHYLEIMRVSNPVARSFYEVECEKAGWSVRELQRQIGSLLFERLALSRDKEGVLALANQGHEVESPADLVKDPYVLEFVGLKDQPPSSWQETRLEQALIEGLQNLLLEMGRDLFFVARQKRISIDGDHFYIDLVFYHRVLRSFLLIDLKVGRLSQQDIGQMLLYTGYYEQEETRADENPPIGLILCTDKNEAVVRYTLSKSASQVFASRYQLHLPSEKELARLLQRSREDFERRAGRDR
jgi:predicted nuclease of restriction endonuclease-like (RecB) superfamily